MTIVKPTPTPSDRTEEPSTIDSKSNGCLAEKPGSEGLSANDNVVGLVGPIDMARIAGVAERAEALAYQIRLRVMAPEVRMVSPRLTVKQAVSLCGLPAAAAKGLCHVTGQSAQRPGRVTVAEARKGARQHRIPFLRPPERQAITIAVANFKGGVSKTTTAMTLAQGLSLRGHKVLAIDLDPQGSLTTLFGILPQTEVAEDMTALPLLRGERHVIDHAIRQTYWDGIDLVPAAPTLFAAEFAIPSQLGQPTGTNFWSVLSRGLIEARKSYDVIVIDTPPALSYLTINALMAADGIVVPVPPTALDFSSLVHFWQLFSDFSNSADIARDGGKTYAFVQVLLSRVDQSDVAAPAVRQWIEAAYGDFLMSAEVPKSTVASAMAASFGTAYDIEAYEGSAATYRRIIEAYNKVIDRVEMALVVAWQRGPQHTRLETKFPGAADHGEAIRQR
jgi:chromosome partitioning protein